MKTFKAETLDGTKVTFSILAHTGGDLFLARKLAMDECDKRGWFLIGAVVL